jgi:UDP-GlcNAc:undecaprenyl-phosphate/decaprenyl-phosphate GlcNAc-1-phosphate transferase
LGPKTEMSNYTLILCCILASALGVTIVACLRALPLGKSLDVIDMPDLGRKQHDKPTPLIGGIAIMMAIAVWVALRILTHQAVSSELAIAICVSGIAVAVVGYLDDRYDVAPHWRLLFVAIFTTVALAFDPRLVPDTLNWVGWEPQHIAPWLGIFFTILAALGLVNAVNLADGLNGLVPGMFVIWAGCLLLLGETAIMGISWIVLLAGLVVLFFNLRGKLFLGDCGTYGVTFVIGLMAAFAHAEGKVALETIAVWFFIPVVDCLRLLVVRPLSGVSPFRADRQHFHHRLEKRLGGGLGVAVYLGAVAISSLIATLVPRFSLVCMVWLAAFYLSVIWVADAAPESEADDAEAVGAGMGRLFVALHGMMPEKQHRDIG